MVAELLFITKRYRPDCYVDDWKNEKGIRVCSLHPQFFWGGDNESRQYIHMGGCIICSTPLQKESDWGCDVHGIGCYSM